MSSGSSIPTVVGDGTVLETNHRRSFATELFINFGLHIQAILQSTTYVVHDCLVFFSHFAIIIGTFGAPYWQYRSNRSPTHNMNTGEDELYTLSLYHSAYVSDAFSIRTSIMLDCCLCRNHRHVQWGSLHVHFNVL
ncbi:hypothetical protein D9756_007874 [Leucocoprinus leucothites]|uniref:Uncharacterized protein n=1 Tax=Leucocoprinus leucothites TaxID=201217 RepID=A0A8H5D471_9AGAR|nr:hypothetical protein D9756_007874 [Leucoagaricus leucothites]